MRETLSLKLFKESSSNELSFFLPSSMEFMIIWAKANLG